jgi:hypothetical protein
MIELRLQKTNRWAKAPPIDSSPSNRNSVCLGSTLKKAQRKRLGDGNAAAIAAGRFRQSASDIRMRVRLWCPQAFPPLRILACRHCHGAAYASQQRDRNGRKRLAASKLRPKLGGCPDIRDNAVTPQNPPSQLQRNPSPRSHSQKGWFKKPVSSELFAYRRFIAPRVAVRTLGWGLPSNGILPVALLPVALLPVALR